MEVAEAMEVEPSAHTAPTAAAVAEQHKRGDLVWAKVFGFPWWPARVCGCLGKSWSEWEGKYPVRFCHSAERLFLKPEQLLVFASRPELTTPPETLKKKAATLAKFVQAVQEARENPTAVRMRPSKRP